MSIGPKIPGQVNAGKSVKQIWGDSDYEYRRRVKREHVPMVLIQLIKDHFSSDVAFHDWFSERAFLMNSPVGPKALDARCPNYPTSKGLPGPFGKGRS